MKRLYILRHAKSSWDDPGLTDFDRPLNDRGKKTAPLMGKVMRERGYIPETIIASPAKRAAKTAKLAAKGGDLKAEIEFDRRIYEAGTRTLTKVISEIKNGAGTAMIVGHNYGMEDLVHDLTGQPEPMPTAALAVIDLEIDKWKDVGPGKGKLVEVLRPKEVLI